MTPPALDHHTTGYRLPHVYWLAKTSELAYEDDEKVHSQLQEWGFDRVRCLSGTNPGPLPMADTQAIVAGSGTMVIVAFRGTEVAKVRDWLSDINAPASPGPGGQGLVHVGFNQALDAVFPQLKDTLAEFRDQHQTLWITGHSLGGALAMLAAARLHFEDPRLLADGVYTFGQPRTCDSGLADSYDSAFTDRHYRFVNNNDIVTQLPTDPPYHHVDAVRYFDSDGNLHESMSALGGLGDHAKGFATNAFAPGTDAVEDHYMRNYISCLEKAVG